MKAYRFSIKDLKKNNNSDSNDNEIIEDDANIDSKEDNPIAIPHNSSEIAEELFNSIDWVKLTNNFNLDRINEIVEKVGRSKKEKRLIIQAIYDAESATENMSSISYNVDELLNELYKENDENHKGLFDDSNDTRVEVIRLDDFMKKTIKEYMERHTATEEDIDEIFKDNNGNIEQMIDEIISLKAQIKNLEEQLKTAKELDKKRIKEIDQWHFSCEHAEAEVSMWMSKYDEASENCKKAEHERDVYKELMRETPGSKKFTVRQTSIIAYALCKKASVIPANKKNISQLFNGISGYSSNSMGQNLCSSYTDEEIEEIAAAVEKDMPAFAAYLREKTFFLPEKKK